MKRVFEGVAVFWLIFVMVLAPVSPRSFLLNVSQAADIKINSTDPVVWDDFENKEVSGWVRVMPGAKLIIKDIADLTFTGEYGGIIVSGELVIEGSKEDKITINKLSEDLNFYILAEEGSKVTIKDAEIIGGGYEAFLSKGITNKALAGNRLGALQVNGGDVSVDYTTFKNCNYAVVSKENLNGNLRVNYSKFITNNEDVWDYNHSDFTNNYWDDFRSDMDTCNSARSVDKCLAKSYGNFKFYPWQEDENFDEIAGASNVLFLPGIKASHLYKYDNDGDLDELWVPNWFGDDVEELELNEDGISKEDVFAREGKILEDTITGNLYKSFAIDLAEMKNEGEINDYKLFSYDWRQDVSDIAQNGTPYENNQTKFIKEEIINLAQNSKSGQVAIVAHSNGGLLAKAAMMELEEDGLIDKVEKLILVGSPQMGTPKAIFSMLYGYDEPLPTLLSQSEARGLVENMPGAYGLLPSKKYLDRVMEDKIIDFNLEGKTERGKLFKDSYDNDIDGFDEFRDFLLAKEDKRQKPDEEMVSQENVLNEKLLNQAIETHDKLDNWTIPANVKVIELAGWGLSTISGINYVEKKETKCKHVLGSSLPICFDGEDYVLVPEPKFTVDGDDVVTAPSALMLEEADNIERYWFDLYSYNDEKIIDRKHSNLLEAENIRDFIKDKLQNKESTLPAHISDSRPEDYPGAQTKIKMSLYSPLDIHLYDGIGNHTGYREIDTLEGKQRILEDNIPNSTYFELGERKYALFDKGEAIDIVLDGYREGGYTLKIEEVKLAMDKKEEILNSITFKNLPVSPETKVSLSIPESGLESISKLEADYDGDDVMDYVLTPVLNGEVTIEDFTPPTIEIISPREGVVYQKNQKLELLYNIQDDFSEGGDIYKKLYLDNNEITGDSLDLSKLKVGGYELKIEAIDEAGNKAEKKVNFTVSTDIYALMDNVESFYLEGFIKTSQEKKMLLNNLEVMEKEILFYQSIKNNIFIKSKTKELLLGITERQIQIHVDIIIKKIKQDKQNYATMIKELIISDLDFIKNNIK